MAKLWDECSFYNFQEKITLYFSTVFVAMVTKYGYHGNTMSCDYAYFHGAYACQVWCASDKYLLNDIKKCDFTDCK